MSDGATEMWRSAREEFEVRTLLVLKMLGKEIGEKAQQGDKTAAEIVNLYSMLYLSFDPMTHELLKQSLDEYIAKNPNGCSAGL